MNHERHAGFTIIEIAVVIVVIGIIASITLVSFGQVQKDSRDQNRVADVSAVKAALSSYYEDNNEYPAPCSDGVSCNVSNLASYLVPAYIPAMPKDPKGIEYNYVYNPSYSRDAYGIYVRFEGSPGPCKTGINVRAVWWSSVANCPDNLV